MKQCIFFCIGCILFFSTNLRAQQKHFIYLQTENKQPFYLKQGNAILSSTLSGYLILSRLKDSTYNFAIGFPKKEWAEQKFECTVAGTDAGYLVKNFGEKGWGLFNLQTLSITMAGVQSHQPLVKEADKTDEFSTLLSSAVNDPSILKNDVAGAASVKADSQVKAAGKQEKIDTPQVVAPVVSDSKTALADAGSGIKKIQETANASGDERIYVVNSKGNSDTVSISIPAEVPVLKNDITEEKKLADPLPKSNGQDYSGKDSSPVIAAVPEKLKVDEDSAVNKNVQAAVTENKMLTDTVNKVILQDTAITGRDKPVKEKFLPIELTPSKEKVVSSTDTAELKKDTAIKNNPEAEKELTSAKPVTVLINSDCVSNASAEDFLKLRKKMAAASSDDDMIAISKKAFKQHCYSTDQVKNLGVLFLKDDGRYNFFDQAYPHVWDSFNYKLLESQITDPYYTNRFRAMIRH